MTMTVSMTMTMTVTVTKYYLYTARCRMRCIHQYVADRLQVALESFFADSCGRRGVAHPLMYGLGVSSRNFSHSTVNYVHFGPLWQNEVQRNVIHLRQLE